MSEVVEMKLAKCKLTNMLTSSPLVFSPHGLHVFAQQIDSGVFRGNRGERGKKHANFVQEKGSASPSQDFPVVREHCRHLANIGIKVFFCYFHLERKKFYLAIRTPLQISAHLPVHCIFSLVLLSDFVFFVFPSVLVPSNYVNRVLFPLTYRRQLKE